jgi:hypothetical protein
LAAGGKYKTGRDEPRKLQKLACLGITGEVRMTSTVITKFSFYSLPYIYISGHIRTHSMDVDAKWY